MKETIATKADSELQCAETRARHEEIDKFVESLVQTELSSGSAP